MSNVPHQNLLQVKPVKEHTEHPDESKKLENTHNEPKGMLETFFAEKAKSSNLYVILIVLIVFGIPAGYLSWRWNKGASTLWRWTCVIFAFLYNIGYLFMFALLAHEASLDNPKWDTTARASYNTTAAHGLLGVQKGGAKKMSKNKK